jgi:adenine-specific DNA-methyltransferase
MPEFSAIRSALLDFAANPTSSAALPVVLGLNPVAAPSDVLHDRTQPISGVLSAVAEGLYRVGAVDTDIGSAGLYVVPLREWGARSADRDRARRRVAKALVEHAPYGDRRWLIALTGGQDHDVEFVLPRVREERRGVGTVRALVQADSPSHFHLALLADLALAPRMSLQEISRKWNEAFSVERVTKRFYLEFRDLRNRIADELVRQNANIPAIASADRRADLDRFVTRQLGRLLFLWFLQAKRWLDSSLRFFEDLFERHCRGAGARNFFRDLLVPLFFDALASPASSKRRTVANELFGAVPYLNGGLFLQTSYEDELFGKDREHVNVDLPNELFDRRLHRDGVPTVLGLLSNYRFATRESTPDDMSVDPDPELLGKVFENLNEDRERHDTGTYYTPREIVHFMCREALDGYLQDAAGVDRSLLQELRSAALEDEPPEKRLPDADRERLEQALDAVKICDPAVGSGAFLVGAMHEIVLLKRGIAHSSTPFRDPEPAEVAGWKRHIISNSLYGVDISPEAIEICQLRLWLSLVLEEEEPEPLPNLDFRIVGGDSLIDRAGDIAFEDSIPRPALQYDLETHERLEHLRKSIAALRDEFAEERDPRDARRLRHGIRERQMEIVRLQLDRHIETAQAQAAAMTAKRNQAERLGAPERTLKQSIRAAKEAWEKVTALTALLDGLEEDAPYRRLFLWPVEFPEVFAEGRRGFDIVLANPPYVRQERLPPMDQLAYQRAFPQVYAGTADILVFFYARAIQILRDSGHLSFITSNKYMRAAYGAAIREHLPKSLQVSRVIDFGDLPVFDAASYPAVLVGNKVNESDTAAPVLVADLTWPIRRVLADAGRPATVLTVREALEDLDTLLEAVAIRDYPQVLLRRSGWILEDPALVRLFDRLMSRGTPLGEFVQGRMYRGVLTGLNEAFVIDEAKRSQLIAADPRSAEVIKRWLRGRDIKRWRPEWAGLYIIAIQNSGDADAANPWAQATTEEEARRIFRETYPAIHDHLSQWEEYPDPKRRGKTLGLRPRADQGRWWWELRACAYYRELAQPKIIWPDMTYSPRFLWDDSGSFTDTTIFQCVGASLSELSLLNSDVAEFLLHSICPTIRGGYLRQKIQYLGLFPIPDLVLEVRNSLAAIASRRDDSTLSDIAYEAFGIRRQERPLLDEWLERRRSLAPADEAEAELEQDDGDYP